MHSRRIQSNNRRYAVVRSELHGRHMLLLGRTCAPSPVAVPARRQKLITDWAAQYTRGPSCANRPSDGCRSQPGEKRASRLLRTCSQASDPTRAPPPVPQMVCRRLDEGAVPVCQLAVLSRFGSSLWRSEESIRISGYQPLCHGKIRHDRERTGRRGAHSGSRFSAHVYWADGKIRGIPPASFSGLNSLMVVLVPGGFNIGIAHLALRMVCFLF